MTMARIERRLAAVLAPNVAGYGRLVGAINNISKFAGRRRLFITVKVISSLHTARCIWARGQARYSILRR